MKTADVDFNSIRGNNVIFTVNRGFLVGDLVSCRDLEGNICNGRVIAVYRGAHANIANIKLFTDTWKDG